MLRKLASQTAIYGISHTLSKFLNYLLVPYLTRIMSDGVYGEVNLYYAIIPLANVVLTMGFATSYFRFAAKTDSEQQKRELFSTLWISVSTLAFIFFVVLSLFSKYLNYTDVAWYMVATAALIMVDNVNAIPFALLREQGRAKLYTIINVSNVVINVVLCYAFYSFIPNAASVAGYVILANLVASLSSTIMLLPSALKMFVKKYSFATLRTITKYSFPLMVAGLMGVASDFIDRQMLKSILPADIANSHVGIYAAVSKIAALMVIFRTVYALGAEPFFLQNFAKDDFKRSNAEATKYFTIAGLAIFLLITLFEPLFAPLIGASFRSGMDVVPLLLLANLFTGMLVSLSFWYKQTDKTRVALYVTISGLAATILLNYVLIPLFGYEGSAWARLASTMIMCLISYFLGQKYYKIPYSRKILDYFIIAVALFFLSRQTTTFEPILRYSINILLYLLYLTIVTIFEWKKLKSLIGR